MKNTMTALKNMFGGFNSRLDEAEERISELEGRAIELSPLRSRELKSRGNVNGAQKPLERHRAHQYTRDGRPRKQWDRKCVSRSRDF